MRLISHNLLSCHAKSCSPPTNFPLLFKNCTKVEIHQTEFNPNFLRSFLSKLDWSALWSATRSLGVEDLSSTAPQLPAHGDLNDDQIQQLKSLHHALLEIHVQDGTMVCPSCGHVFTIKDGIPNMLLHEDEVS